MCRLKKERLFPSHRHPGYGIRSHFSTPQVILDPLLHLSFPKKNQPVPPPIACHLDPGKEGHSPQTLATQLLHMYHGGEPREALVIVVHGSIVTWDPYTACKYRISLVHNIQAQQQATHPGKNIGQVRQDLEVKEVQMLTYPIVHVTVLKPLKLLSVSHLHSRTNVELWGL